MHAWRKEVDGLDHPYHEEQTPGYLLVSAVCAGAHVMRAFLREAKARLKRQTTWAIWRVLSGTSNHKLLQMETY